MEAGRAPDRTTAAALVEGQRPRCLIARRLGVTCGAASHHRPPASASASVSAIEVRRRFDRDPQRLVQGRASGWREPSEDGLTHAVVVRLDRVDPAARRSCARGWTREGSPPLVEIRPARALAAAVDDLQRQRLARDGDELRHCRASGVSTGRNARPDRVVQQLISPCTPIRRARPDEQAPRRTAGVRRLRWRFISGSAYVRARPLEEQRGDRARIRSGEVREMDHLGISRDVVRRRSSA